MIVERMLPAMVFAYDGGTARPVVFDETWRLDEEPGRVLSRELIEVERRPPGYRHWRAGEPLEGLEAVYQGFPDRLKIVYPYVAKEAECGR